MVVERESVEEEKDVEHFEDVKEKDDIDPIKEAEKERNNVELSSRDGDSSSDDEEEKDLAVTQSDEENEYGSDDEEEELFVKETSHDLKETIKVSNNSEKEAKRKSSCLPGGYDPGHREPS